MQKSGANDPLRLAVMIGALGVVFGDIGTSPIYTLQTLFNPGDPHPVPVNENNVLGVVSLIFWSITMIVTVTYILLAMRVDNDGEGGVMALITLLRRWSSTKGSRTRNSLTLLGLFGASLFLGDSMITPAISVLSSVEGLRVVSPSLDGAIVPVTAVIIVLLFTGQKFGTAKVGRLFGPVMVVWFSTIGVLGLFGIAKEPQVLFALSPTYAIGFLANHFEYAFFALAAVVLSVTGAEAIYADMGHFGRKPISIAWIFLVFPALAMSYLGQGALILNDASNIAAPFFLLSPDWLRIPLVVLATAATVIAAQSVITGAFSVTSQAAQLGYLPRLRILHTSSQSYGQIYVPWINWMLMVSVLTLVFAMRSSINLAYAYGMAVTGTITMTTSLFFYVALRTWRAPKALLLTMGAILLSIDLMFLSANMTKLIHGSWLPLLIAITLFTVMITWYRGREVVTAKRLAMEGSLKDFIADLEAAPSRAMTLPGTAIYLNRGDTTVPLALRANVELNHVRHEQTVIVSVVVESVPRVDPIDRIGMHHIGNGGGVDHLTLHFGYTEQPDVPKALAELDDAYGADYLDLEHATYFISKIELHEGEEHTMSRWRKRLFIATSYITVDADDHFRLPPDRTLISGSRVEV